MFDMFSGGALGRMTIFALNIMPYISASIIIQLLTAVSPTLEALKKEGESGRKKLNQYTRYGTVAAGRGAVLRHRGRARGHARPARQSAVIDPGLFFRLVTVITLTGGTVFLMWLGEQITARGIGNGISLIIMAGIVANLPHALAATLELGRTGAISTVFIIIFLLMSVVVVDGHRLHGAGAAPHPRAVPEAPAGQPHVRRRSLASAAEDQHLGRDPADLRLVAAAAAGDDREFRGAAARAIGWIGTITAYLAHGTPLYMALYIGLIVFFCFFYTAIVFNPAETADNLRKYGGFIPGIRPGQEHRRLSRLRADPHHRGRRDLSRRRSASCPRS